MLRALVGIGVTICWLGCGGNKTFKSSSEGTTWHFEDLRTRSAVQTDIQPQIQRALDIGARVVTLSEGNFFLGKPLVIRHPNVVISGMGPDRTRLYSNGNSLLDVRIANVYEESYEQRIEVGTDTLTLNDVSAITDNMMVTISAAHGMPESTSGGYSSHHTGTIMRVLGDQIILDRPVQIPFAELATVAVFRRSPFTLQGLTLESDHTAYIVEVRNTYGLRITDVVFRTPREVYMGVFREANPVLGVSALGVYHSSNVQVSGCEFQNIWYGLMAHNGCYDVRMRDCTAKDSRHINNSGIGTDKFRVEYCLAISCEGGFDSHPTALETIFIGCKDSLARFESKFRGRRDSIINCSFDRGIELSTDEGILDLATDTNSLYKIVLNTVVSGGRVFIQAANTRIAGCLISATVLPAGVCNRFSIENTIIDLSANVLEGSGLTLANAPASGCSYSFSIKNVSMSGPGRYEITQVPIGVYIPMSAGTSGTLENVSISGFNKGLVLYGGEESSERYQGVSMRNIQIQDCAYGIFQQPFTKVMAIADIGITNCDVEDNAPGKISSMH